jgi:hypothetical protein
MFMLESWSKGGRTLLATTSVNGKSTMTTSRRFIMNDGEMNLHGAAAMLTFNVPDFTRFSGITVLDPRELFNEAPRNETRTDS